MQKYKIGLILLVAVLIFLFFLLDLDAYFTLEYFQARRLDILRFRDSNPVLSSAIYFGIYVVVAALSLPAAAILTVIGGAVFGLWWGLLLVSFASSIGATLAFLVARTLLRDWVQDRFGHALKAINRGMEKDGNFYLFTLRLIPVFPFFLVNLAMALTPISARAFYLVSQAGMLFGTALYVNVGAQLGLATSVTGVMSIGVIRAVLVLAIFPWVAKYAVRAYRNRRAMRDYPRPKHFDTNLVVIGGGSAGLVTSYIAALVKARVILIEKDRMGGDCLNRGCVPSKSLIRAARVNHMISQAGDYGIEVDGGRVDFARVMQRIRRVITDIEPHDSVERYTARGVECIKGEARVVSPYQVMVNGRTIATRAIVVATGSRPHVPAIPGIEETGYLTSDSVWELDSLPEKLLVLGGGPIGCELAQAFSRLGSRVSIVGRADQLLPREDEDVAACVTESLEGEGVAVSTAAEVIGFEVNNGVRSARVRRKGEECVIAFDQLLVATGRRANVSGFGLEDLDVPLTRKGALEVNECLQTRFPNIYACGDVAGPYQFTHMAAFEAWYASINSLFGSLKKFRVNYSVVPWATFTDPEVGRVGLNEKQARESKTPYELTTFSLDDLDRAIVEGETRGFIKVLTVPGKDRILGATIVGNGAAETLAEFVTAMTHNLGLKKILATIHPYPTLMEGNKYAAGQWRKNNAPDWALKYLERFHRWKRS